jgi:hypothetical protein
MNIAPLSPLPTFFVETLSYDVTTLRVTLSVEGRSAVAVRFESPRAFRSFSESGYWHYFSSFDGRALVTSTGPDCGIWMSDSAPYLIDYREHVRMQEPEDTFSCLIATPQECVEVICFEEPSIRAV